MTGWIAASATPPGWSLRELGWNVEVPSPRLSRGGRTGRLPHPAAFSASLSAFSAGSLPQITSLA